MFPAAADRQTDLFDRPSPVGLTTGESIVTPSEERMLIAGIDATALSPFRVHGWLGKRLTASHGCRYDFDSRHFRPADLIPNWLLPLRDRAAVFAQLAPDELVQALVIRYDPGAGIGWHRDRPVFEHVRPGVFHPGASVDLGPVRDQPLGLSDWMV